MSRVGWCVLLLLGCAPPATRTFGGFEVELKGLGFEVRAPGDKRVLLRSAADTEGAYAPVAVGAGKVRVEMKYGSFRFDEGLTQWAAIAKARWGEEGRILYEDAAGSLVASVLLASPSEGVLTLGLISASDTRDRVSLAFECAANDHFLGFGAQADALDHRGHKVALWTSEPGIGKSSSDEPGELWFLEGTRHASSWGLPTWLSNRGYVGALGASERSVFELCSVRDDAWRVEVWSVSTQLTLYDGPTPAGALQRATDGLLGHQPAPPPMAFAPWNDAVRGSAQVRAVAKVLRENQIPSSAIWTEDFRGGTDVPGQGYRLVEEWDLDRTLYPDAEALAAELNAQGFAWFAYFNTFVVEGTRVHAAAKRKYLIKDATGADYSFSGVTFAPTGLVDLTSRAAVEFVQSYLDAALQVGFDGWMADYGEWLPHDAVLSTGMSALQMHNMYPLQWAALNREALQRRAQDGKQRLFFSRAGTLGSNRDTPVVWAGDQRTSFQKDDGLYTVVPLGLGLGLGGVSTFGSDIAGYQSATNPPSTKELFFRWTTLGALTPVMRTHHGLDAAANWRFDKDAETLAHYKRWATFHLRLYPYLSAGALLAAQYGQPLMRALPLAFPDSAPAWTASDTYLLGPNLFVAPVLDEGATTRTFWLPPGTWYPLFGGAALEGDREVTVSAPVGEIPVFARAGTVLPLLGPDVQTLLPTPAAAGADAVREVWVFPGTDARVLEPNGNTWALDADDYRGAPMEDGAVLPDCAAAAQRGCTVAENGRLRIRTRGTGRLLLDGQQLSYFSTATTVDVVWQAE